MHRKGTEAFCNSSVALTTHLPSSPEWREPGRTAGTINSREVKKTSTTEGKRIRELQITLKIQHVLTIKIISHTARLALFSHTVERMRRALSVLQIYAAETSALMKVLVSCTRITEQQQGDSHARFLDTAGVPSISYYKTPSVLSHGEGVELNQTSPLEEALAMALVPIRKLKDWTDPQRNWRCSAICKRRQPEQSFRGTSLETQATISARHSFCLCVRRRLVVWHMHINTNQNFSDKVYPVIPRQRLLSCSVSSWQSNFGSLFSSTALKGETKNPLHP